MYPRFSFECCPPATPLPCRFHQVLSNGSRHKPLRSLLDPSFTTPHSLTSLESADPKNALITPLQSADPKIQHLKPFRIRTYKIRRGEGGELLTSSDQTRYRSSTDFRKGDHRVPGAPQVAALILRCHNSNLALIQGSGHRSPASTHRSPFLLGATYGNAR
jgi:hypothetical protein